MILHWKSIYCCVIYFTYFIYISLGGSLPIVQEKEKTERVKRMVGGGDLPPLPMSSHNSASNSQQNGGQGRSRTQEIPFVQTDSQTYDVNVGGGNIPNSNPNNQQSGYNTAGQGRSRYPASSTRYGSNTATSYGTSRGSSRGSNSQPQRTRAQGQQTYYNNNPGYNSYYLNSAGNQGSGLGGYYNGQNRVRMSNDPNCPPSDRYRLLINNMRCNRAVDVIGKFICYNYERSSRECCQKCLAVKNPSQRGCEYGDRSNQCTNIEPFDCYSSRTREICCERCYLYFTQMQTGINSCEYGDLTPRCTAIRRQSHLCYLPENQRLCCITCPRLADRSKPGCKWGDQNPEMCNLFNPSGVLMINCYSESVKQVCCSSCERLRNRTENNIPGCEYGDRPVSFSTIRGVLSCANYVRTFGVQVCDFSDINEHCCHTCYRYRQLLGRRG